MKFIYLLILFKIIILCTRNSALQLQVALFSINISTYLQIYMEGLIALRAPEPPENTLVDVRK